MQGASLAMDDAATMHVFVVRALDKIMKILSRRKFPKLWAACQDALQSIRDSEGKQGSDADQYFPPFLLACESKNPRVIEAALDCLQKLIAYGYLRGKGPDDRNPARTLMDSVVDTICKCFDTRDDAVQLQIIKALLTAVSSNTCDVHEVSLLMAIRTVYNIHLVSQNMVNQSTAKATLWQMLSRVFQRMEQAALTTQEDGPSTHPTAEEVARSVVEELVDSVCNPDGSTNTRSSAESSVGKYGYCIVCKRPANHFCVQTKDPVCSIECKARNLEIKGRLQDQMGTSGDYADFGSTEMIGGGGFVDILQKDAFLVFRALCKLSMKNIPMDVQGSDFETLRPKVLSLELLSRVLETAGPTFRTGEKFIYAIKHYLCLSLLKNCVSPLPEVFKVSIGILTMLIKQYKEHLKTEIGVFFTNVFFRIMESENSTFQQKQTVLAVFKDICQDPQTIVDLFLNYDCDEDSMDVFQRMVDGLSKIAQGTHVVDNWVTKEQEGTLKLLGLEILVIIERSMVDWSNKLIDSQQAGEEEMEKDESAPATPNLKNDLSPDDTAREVADALADLDKFEKSKGKKLELQEGVVRFNLKPKKGLQYLVAAGRLTMDPETVSKFFLTTDGLDKTQIGDYMGDADTFNIQVLYAYVDNLDFSGLSFDEGIRKFLSGFRLPGEAQKIDRMMEKFAERYCACNEGAFASADSAFVLAYSVIMLNTDLHNPMVKNKMTKAEFVRNNRGINEGGDLPQEYLERLYDNIEANEIKVKEDQDSWGRRSGLIHPRKRQEIFNQQSEDVVKMAQRLFKEKARKKSVFHYAKNVEHVRPMFAIAWCPYLAAFSVLLEEVEDDRIIDLCLEGFRYSIRISAMFYMETERNAFVSSLAKFTVLSSAKEMKEKNVKSIETLIQVAHEVGNFLQDSWGQVLHCISQLDHLQVLGAGVKPEDQFFTNTEHVKVLKGRLGGQRGAGKIGGLKTGPSTDATRRSAETSKKLVMDTTPSQGDSVIDLKAQIISEKIDVVSIDRIFSASNYLNQDAIVDFVRNLCMVSREELEQKIPRTFSLQKLVEVTYYNMDRIRYVWTKIWMIISDHLITVGLHPNLSISMFCIDSIRQLAIKFLERDELSNYHFQKEFLKPFELIMQKAHAVEVRELITRCLTQMVHSRIHNIKSGWKSMFLAFSAAACDHYEAIVALGFEVVEWIVREHFNLILENFVDCVNCLAKNGANMHSVNISMKAIDYLQLCAGELARGRIFSTTTFSDSKKHLHHWFPILTGLSRLVGDSRLHVRSKALDALFAVLRDHGSLFSPQLWELIFKGTLFPIFDDVRHPDEQRQGQVDEWLNSTCMPAFHALVELYSSFFDTLGFLLRDMIDLLSSCIKQSETEGLARIGVTCLTELVRLTGARFSDDVWLDVGESFRRLFIDTTPQALNSFSRPLPRSPGGSSTPSEPAAPIMSLSVFTDGEYNNAENEEQGTRNRADVSPPSTAAATAATARPDGLKSIPEARREERSHLSVQWALGQLGTDEMDGRSVRSEGTIRTDFGTAGSIDDVAADTISISTASEHLEHEPEEVKRGDTNRGEPPALEDVQEEEEVEEQRTTEAEQAEEETKEKRAIEREEEEEEEKEKRGSAASSPTSFLPPARQPREITPPGPKDSQELFQAMRCQCVVQLLLIQATGDILHHFFSTLRGDHFDCFFSALEASYNFAGAFNANMDLRIQLWRAGFMRQLPNLLKQRTNSLQCYFRFLFRLYGVEKEETRVKGPEFAGERLLALCVETLQEYVTLDSAESEEDHREMVAMTPIIVQILQGILGFSSAQFKKHLRCLYPLFTQLILCTSLEVRRVLRDVFAKREILQAV